MKGSLVQCWGPQASQLPESKQSQLFCGDWTWVVRLQGQEVIYKVLRVDLLFGLFKEFERVGQKDISDPRKVAALV